MRNEMTSKQIERKIEKVLRAHENALRGGASSMQADSVAFESLYKLQNQIRWVAACERPYTEEHIAAAYAAVKSQSEYFSALKTERAVPRHEKTRDWRTL